MAAWNLLSLAIACLAVTAEVSHAQDAAGFPAAAVGYPPMMRGANVEGDASVAVVVDGTGRPIRGTARTISATHELFAQAVKSGVARWALGPRERATWLRGDTLVVVVAFRFWEAAECPPAVRTNFRGVIPPLAPARETLAWDEATRSLRIRLVSCHESRMVESVP